MAVTGMTLAKADANDFRRMWSIHLAQQRLDQAGWSEDSETRELRCKAVILGRLDQLGGGFTRVVMGAEMLIKNCCHPGVDHLEYKPVLGAAPEMLAALTAAEAHLARLRDERSHCHMNPVTGQVEDEAGLAGLRDDDAVLTQLRAAMSHANGAAP